MKKRISFGPYTERAGGHCRRRSGVTAGVPQGRVLGPLPLLAYVNEIWITMETFANE
jgi:hypothetical protein